MILLSQFIKIKMVNYGLEWQMVAYINLMDRHLKSNFEQYERTTACKRNDISNMRESDLQANAFEN